MIISIFYVQLLYFVRWQVRLVSGPCCNLVDCMVITIVLLMVPGAGVGWGRVEGVMRPGKFCLWGGARRILGAEWSLWGGRGGILGEGA